jgi:hypothetical protein
MARRSLIKRIARVASSVSKNVQNQGRKLEQSIAESCNTYAGPEYVEKIKNCQASGKECLCAQTREAYIKTNVACVPYRIQRFKDEVATFNSKITHPGNLTVGDLSAWPVVILAALFLFWLGESIGRWNIYGYSYDKF